MATVQWLLNNGATLAEKSSNGFTALLAAIHSGHLTTVQWLVKRGANLNEKVDNGGTALLLAVHSGELAMVQWLLHNGATLSEKSDGGVTALLLAAANGQLTMVQWLLDHGALLSEKDNDGITALLFAAKNGHLDMIKWLINHGAMLSEKDNDGDTALLVAAAKGHLAIVKWLLANGAKLSERNNDNITALLAAALNGQLATVQWLIENTITKVNEIDNYGDSALHLAAQEGYLNIVKWLVLYAHANLEARNYQGYNAMFVAAQYDQFHVMRWLFHKKSINSKNTLIESKNLSRIIQQKLIFEIILKSCGAKLLEQIHSAPKGQRFFETNTYFDLLPNELIKSTLMYLPEYELISLAKVNVFFHQCITDNFVWKKIFIRRLGNAPIINYLAKLESLSEQKENSGDISFFKLYFHCNYLKIMYEFIIDDSCNNLAFWKNFTDIYLTVKNSLKKDIDKLIEHAIGKNRGNALNAILFFKPDKRGQVLHFVVQANSKN